MDPQGCKAHRSRKKCGDQLGPINRRRYENKISGRQSRQKARPVNDSLIQFIKPMLVRELCSVSLGHKNTNDIINQGGVRRGMCLYKEATPGFYSSDLFLPTNSPFKIDSQKRIGWHHED